MLTPNLFRSITTAFIEIMRYLILTKDSSVTVAWQLTAYSLNFIFNIYNKYNYLHFGEENEILQSCCYGVFSSTFQDDKNELSNKNF